MRFIFLCKRICKEYACVCALSYVHRTVPVTKKKLVAAKWRRLKQILKTSKSVGCWPYVGTSGIVCVNEKIKRKNKLTITINGFVLYGVYICGLGRVWHIIGLVQ